MVGPNFDKSVVLVGAGNAHLQVVRMWPMKGLAKTRLILVSESSEVPYSALVPAVIAGDLKHSEAMIDLVKLCARTGAEFIEGTVTDIDFSEKRVEIKDRSPVAFDLISLNVGSRPENPPDSGPHGEIFRYGISTKPLSGLMDRIAVIQKDLFANPRPFRWVIVGGGPGGCEIACAIRKAFHKLKSITVTLIQAQTDLAVGHDPKVSKFFRETFTKKGIELELSTQIVRADSTHLVASDGRRISYDAFVWAVRAEPLPWLRKSSPKTDERGFLKARRTLQIDGFDDGFAVGDCIALEGHPDLPKAGVFAVREGPVLLKNLRARLLGEALSSYHPQKRALGLFNTSDGDAIMSYGKLSSKGSWISHWKHSIDEKWMEKFRKVAPMGNVNESQMFCGGCAAKVPQEALLGVLGRLQIASHPDILVGLKDSEDVAIQRVPAGKLMAQTTDFFRAFLSDSFLVGKIAGVNALSDLYAKNAAPFSALAQVTVPFGNPSAQKEQLFLVLSGAISVFEKEGVFLTGGHSAQGTELGVGFTVTGFLDEGQMFRKRALNVGDVLILTKRLGSGALLAAHMRGECEAGWFSSLISSLTSTNANASKIFAKFGVKAATDVTGFGLAGHLLEMLDQSGKTATLWPQALPIYDGFADVAAKGIQSTLYPSNVNFQERIEKGNLALPEILFDPQTSGGLLGGVPERSADALLKALRAEGVEASLIGKVVSDEKSPARRVTLSRKQ